MLYLLCQGSNAFLWHFPFFHFLLYESNYFQQTVLGPDGRSVRIETIAAPRAMPFYLAKIDHWRTIDYIPNECVTSITPAVCECQVVFHMRPFPLKYYSAFKLFPINHITSKTSRTSLSAHLGRARNGRWDLLGVTMLEHEVTRPSASNRYSQHLYLLPHTGHSCASFQGTKHSASLNKLRHWKSDIWNSRPSKRNEISLCWKCGSCGNTK